MAPEATGYPLSHESIDDDSIDEDRFYDCNYVGAFARLQEATLAHRASTFWIVCAPEGVSVPIFADADCSERKRNCAALEAGHVP